MLHFKNVYLSELFGQRINNPKDIELWVKTFHEILNGGPLLPNFKTGQIAKIANDKDLANEIAKGAKVEHLAINQPHLAHIIFSEYYQSDPHCKVYIDGSGFICANPQYIKITEKSTFEMDWQIASLNPKKPTYLDLRDCNINSNLLLKIIWPLLGPFTSKIKQKQINDLILTPNGSKITKANYKSVNFGIIEKQDINPVNRIKLKMSDKPFDSLKSKFIDLTVFVDKFTLKYLDEIVVYLFGYFGKHCKLIGNLPDNYKIVHKLYNYMDKKFYVALFELDY